MIILNYMLLSISTFKSIRVLLTHSDIPKHIATYIIRLPNMCINLLLIFLQWEISVIKILVEDSNSMIIISQRE